MNVFMKFYKWPVGSLIVALFLGAWIGFVEGGSIASALTAVLTVGILCVLEISLSFDNAVLNAKKLATMDEKWRAWFVKWGMLIAVFGMRLVFPILIVAILGHMTPWTAVELALTNPKQYTEILTASHHLVSSFGGAFLMMVALEFFLDHEKGSHWLRWIEEPISKIGAAGIVVDAVIVTALIIGASFAFHGTEQVHFIYSGVAGIVLFIAIHFLKEYLEGHDATESAANVGKVVSSGLAGVLYLEILDASMSFDGVIAAFAITNYIFIVMLGLGVGAFFVREVTLHLLEAGSLTEFRYMENGAFWAIFALATIMLISGFVDVPEVVTGLIGVVFLGAAVYHSHLLNKKEENIPTT